MGSGRELQLDRVGLAVRVDIVRRVAAGHRWEPHDGVAAIDPNEKRVTRCARGVDLGLDSVDSVSLRLQTERRPMRRRGEPGGPGAVRHFDGRPPFGRPILNHREPVDTAILGLYPAGLTGGSALERFQGQAVEPGAVLPQVDVDGVISWNQVHFDRVGGLMVYGIPNFKLDKAIVARRAQRLVDGGIVFELGFDVGRDASLADLRSRHDAVLIAVGTYKARELKAPGVGLDHIVPALPYLITANRMGFGDDIPAAEAARYNARGKRVVVIGGGDTAMDCVRTAKRQGAKSVICLYRRDRANMPGSAREVENAEEEGVVFEWLQAPESFLGRRKVSAVRVHRMRLGAPDATGRQSPEPVPGSSRSLKADLVILALGFDPEPLPEIFAAEDLATTRWGTLLVDPETMMTSVDGVFAAGDIVRGASLVVWAIREAQQAAAAIHRYLERRDGAGDGSAGAPELVAAD